ncbi:MAG: hypothetical protein AAGK14_06675 [Verrucomicrobiota bacterium]
MKAKWILLAVGGLLLTGTGLSVFGEAVLRKGAPGAVWQDWFWMGTLSLVLINAGLCCVVEAGHTKRSSS